MRKRMISWRGTLLLFPLLFAQDAHAVVTSGGGGLAVVILAALAASAVFSGGGTLLSILHRSVLKSSFWGDAALALHLLAFAVTCILNQISNPKWEFASLDWAIPFFICFGLGMLISGGFLLSKGCGHTRHYYLFLFLTVIAAAGVLLPLAAIGIDLIHTKIRHVRNERENSEFSSSIAEAKSITEILKENASKGTSVDWKILRFPEKSIPIWIDRPGVKPSREELKSMIQFYRRHQRWDQKSLDESLFKYIQAYFSFSDIDILKELEDMGEDPSRICAIENGQSCFAGFGTELLTNQNRPRNASKDANAEIDLQRSNAVGRLDLAIQKLKPKSWSKQKRLHFASLMLQPIHDDDDVYLGLLFQRIPEFDLTELEVLKADSLFRDHSFGFNSNIELPHYAASLAAPKCLAFLLIAARASSVNTQALVNLQLESWRSSGSLDGQPFAGGSTLHLLLTKMLDVQELLFRSGGQHLRPWGKVTFEGLRDDFGDTIKLLLNQGLDLNIKNDEEQTALELLEAEGSQKLKDYLQFVRKSK